MKNILLILSAILMLSCSSDDHNFKWAGTTWLSEDGQSTITFLNDKELNIINEDGGNQTHGYESNYGKVNGTIDTHIFITLNYTSEREVGEVGILGFLYKESDNKKIFVEESYQNEANLASPVKMRTYFRQ